MSATTLAAPKPSALGNVLAFCRLELVESLRSKWVAFTFALYAVVFGAFVWVGLGESTVLGFTGLGRVVLNLTNAIVLAIPLLVLIATSQVVVRARRSGLLEMLLAQPCRRSDWFWGVLSSRVVVLLAPLVVVFAAIALFGAREEGLLAIVARSLSIAAALIWAFTGVGLLISAIAKTPERAIVMALLVWLTASALHDFALMGVLLHANLPPRVVFALAAVNPSEAARIGILTSVDPELSVLGPVGFWLANTLGSTKALLVAIGWPALLGTACLAVAKWRIARSDAVG